jgi:transcription elongation GreA/GreB family factor
MMSVAFRRESDEEHKEPKFELPLPAGPNLVTRRGLALIAAKVSELEAFIATHADDPEIETTKRTLRYWHTRQTTAQLAPPPEPGVAGFGTRVTFLMGGRERVIDIVGDDEADPAQDRLSFSAPLSKALIGGEVGDALDFGGKTEAIEIVAVEVIGD